VGFCPHRLSKALKILDTEHRNMAAKNGEEILGFSGARVSILQDVKNRALCFTAM
jgi:hypothetical protein